MKKSFISGVMLFAAASLHLVSCAQTGNYSVDGIPHEMQMYNSALDVQVNGNTISLTGGEGSRLYVDPSGSSSADSAPMLLFDPDETFQLSCKVTADLNYVFDAGVLILYADSANWAKYCLEYSVEEKPILVSVVNNTLSDDCDHFVMESNEMYMRISGLGDGVYGMHYSRDGEVWHMVRYFHLDKSENMKVGFLSQSPRGSSCKTVFSEIRYTSQKLENMRSGQ